MIDLYYWPTPNGWKISIALEEMELPYTVKLREHRRAASSSRRVSSQISPNNRMPAIVDHAPADGGAPLGDLRVGRDPALPGREERALSAARSARTLRRHAVDHVADGRPRADERAEPATSRLYAPEPVPYAIDRYTDEVEPASTACSTTRLQPAASTSAAVLDRQTWPCWPWIASARAPRAADRGASRTCGAGTSSCKTRPHCGAAMTSAARSARSARTVQTKRRAACSLGNARVGDDMAEELVQLRAARSRRGADHRRRQSQRPLADADRRCTRGWMRPSAKPAPSRPSQPAIPAVFAAGFDLQHQR